MANEEQAETSYVKFAAKLTSSALEGNTLSGVAHAFGTKTMRNGKWETFAQGSFDKVLKDPMTDGRAFVNHNPDLLLGRQSAGTLKVEAKEDGLHFSIDLPNTSYANDLKESVKRGDLDGVSFGFIPGKWTTFTDPQGISGRIHTEAGQFIDISPCALPAFGGTTIELRSDELQALMTAAAEPVVSIVNAANANAAPAAVDPRETALRIRNRGLSRK